MEPRLAHPAEHADGRPDLQREAASPDAFRPLPVGIAALVIVALSAGLWLGILRGLAALL